MVPTRFAVAGMRVARQFRRGKALAASATVEWFATRVFNHIKMTTRTRMQLATSHLKRKIVANISIPVVQTVTGKVVVRSQRKEFPRQETGTLMKSIYSDVRESDLHQYEGRVGSGIFYGQILEDETKLDRSFLQRTLEEEGHVIRKILSGPIFK